MSPRPVTLVAHDVGGIGGMERQLAELVTGIASRGRRVTVVARTCELGPTPNVEFVRVRAPARPFLLAFPWFFLAATVQLARRDAGILHTTGAIVGTRASISTIHLCHQAIGARTELIRASRATWYHRLNARGAAFISRAAERYSYSPRRSHHLVAVSPGVKRELDRFFPRASVTVIPNAVDASAFSPDPDRRAAARRRLGFGDEPVALFVGSEWEGKGLRYALEAVGRAPGWRLLVVGHGDVVRFEAMAASAGAGDRVTFFDPTPEIADIYRAADTFVLPSAYETFSLVTYEAAASGLPLVVTRVSGVEDIVESGVNGWFVEQDADEIATCLEVLRDTGVREQMGRASVESVGGYTWSRVIAAYDRLYEELGR